MRKRHTTRHPGISYRLVDESKPDGPRRYIVWYSDANGDGHTKTLPLGATLEDAKTERGNLHVRKANGETLLRTRETVGELVDNWLEHRRHDLADKTIEVYETFSIPHIKRLIGRRRATDLTPSDVARMIATLKKEGKKTWSVKKILAPLSGAYRLAVRDGVVASSPVQKLLPSERPKADQRQMRALSVAEIQALLGATSVTRWKTLFAVLAFTGLRSGEALALRWDDLDEGTLRVRKSKTQAGVREVMLIPSVRRLLNEWKLQQEPGLGFVFAAHSDAPPGRREALRALNKAEEKAGLPKYTLHELRHTFASMLIGQGELPTLVAKQMGHADPSITMRVYAHLWEEQESMEKARERLQDAMGGVL